MELLRIISLTRRKPGNRAASVCLDNWGRLRKGRLSPLKAGMEPNMLEKKHPQAQLGVGNAGILNVSLKSPSLSSDIG